MTDNERVIKGLEQFKSDFKPFCGNATDWARVDDAIVLLKEQDNCENCVIAIEDRKPVVRCKDCKHYMTIHCICDGCCISDDWYCADGERRC